MCNSCRIFNKSISIPAITPWLILVITIWATINTSLKKGYQDGAIEADAKGYYAYLPAVFVYHDLNYGFFEKIERTTYYNSHLEYDYLRHFNGKRINKYYSGTAVCLLPFFITAHVITKISGSTADGYSYIYMLMAHIGALLYLLAGLIGLQKLLRFYSGNETNIAFVMIAVVFGTNLFYYTVTEFAMSHIYSFAAITWFCFFAKKFFTTGSYKYLFFNALLLGLIVLIRPVNLIIVLATPFLAGSTPVFWDGLKQLFNKPVKLVFAFALFVCIISIQLIIYKLSTGSFWVYSYKNEGFNFLNPQMFNFLFSYRKGMFIYTPLLLISLVGFISLFRVSRFQFYSLAAFFIVLVYVFSSWHMWFYGGSFSQRVMIEYYALFSILLALSIHQFSEKIIKNFYIGLIVLLIIFCQIQTYQYRRMQIHWSDMDKTKYWNVFLRIDKL